MPTYKLKISGLRQLERSVAAQLMGFQSTPRANEAVSFLEQLLTGVIKNWKGGVPPEIMSKDNEHPFLQQTLLWEVTHPSIESRGLHMLRG